MSKPPTETRPDRIEEVELMRAIANGNEEAFRRFNVQYRQLIFSTVFKVVNNPDDAEDLTNEVLVKIWRNAHTFHSSRGSLVAWICTTARNRAIDHIRSLVRRSRLNDRFQVELETGNPDNSQCGWEEIEGADTRGWLSQEMQRLPEEQREVLELVYFQGMTQKQAAETLQRPVGTVKARIQRALAKLKSVIEANRLRDSLLTS